MTVRRITYGVLGVLCLLACDNSDGEAERATAADAQELVCNPVSFVPEPDLTVYFDAVALPTVPRQGAALLAVARPDPSGDDEYFAKYGLWFRGDQPITIAVEDPQSGAELNWEGRSKVVVTPTGCSADSKQWSGIVGGYLVPRPQCLALRVTAGSESEIVHIGVGVPCPGQDPPVTAPG